MAADCSVQVKQDNQDIAAMERRSFTTWVSYVHSMMLFQHQ